MKNFKNIPLKEKATLEFLKENKEAICEKLIPILDKAWFTDEKFDIEKFGHDCEQDGYSFRLAEILGVEWGKLTDATEKFWGKDGLNSYWELYLSYEEFVAVDDLLADKNDLIL